jgi:hypothetical protein
MINSSNNITLVNGVSSNEPVPDKIGIDDYRDNTMIIW